MSRIQKEKDIIRIMINLYCSKKHKDINFPCPQCQDLMEYANQRLDNCRYGVQKSYCGKCKTPCYNKDMKRKIKKVMRFSGPRLLVYKPIEFFRYVLKNKMNKSLDT